MATAPTPATHLYTLDVPYLVETRQSGTPQKRCAVCHGSHDSVAHIPHKRDCKNRYGAGSSQCAACRMEADAVIATGCTTNPYAETCGDAASGEAPCSKCHRRQGTD